MSNLSSAYLQPSILFKNTDDGIDNIVMKFVDDIRLEEIVSTEKEGYT